MEQWGLFHYLCALQLEELPDTKGSGYIWPATYFTFEKSASTSSILPSIKVMISLALAAGSKLA